MGESQTEHSAGARRAHVKKEGDDGREKTKCLHGKNFNPECAQADYEIYQKNILNNKEEALCSM